MRAGVVRSILAANLPDPAQTLLLRTCLLDREASRQAWASLLRTGVNVSDLLTHGGHGVRRLAPLLYAALSAHDLEADPALLTRCRMAAMREELRAAAFGRIAAGVFDDLESAGVPFIVLKGAALAEPFYGDPALRHSHDLELLVPPAAIEEASAALRAAGWEGNEPLRAGGKLRLHHDSGLPVVLRSRLFEPALYGGEWSWCTGRTVRERVAGRSVSILSAALALHHVCVHASYGHGRSSLQWVTDAMMLMRSEADGTQAPLDWDDAVNCVERMHTGLLLSTTLGYLSHELDAEIPGYVTRTLDEACDGASSLEREVALRCLWWGRPHQFTRALRARVGWIDRIRLAWRIAFPSAAYAGYRLGANPTFRARAAYYAGRATRQTGRFLFASR